MDELKPCPFCGKTADIITDVSCFSESFAYVQCLFCHAQSTAFYDRGHPRAAFDEAVEAWNRRESEITMPQINVIYCKDCKYFRAYTDGTYGNCTRTINHGAVYRKNDYCSYAEPRKPNAEPFPELDDHTVSGLLDD